jgi:hypothetical protein
LQAIEQPIGIPPEIMKKSQEARNIGGANMLIENMQTLRVLAKEDEDLLIDVRLVKQFINLLLD